MCLHFVLLLSEQKKKLWNKIRNNTFYMSYLFGEVSEFKKVRIEGGKIVTAFEYLN